MLLLVVMIDDNHISLYPRCIAFNWKWKNLVYNYIGYLQQSCLRGDVCVQKSRETEMCGGTLITWHTQLHHCHHQHHQPQQQQLPDATSVCLFVSQHWKLL